MFHVIRNYKGHFLNRIFVCLIAMSLVFSPTVVYAQSIMPVLNLPVPGVMVQTSAVFNPPLIKGITVHPDNPLAFDFIVNKGDQALTDEALHQVSEKMIKYFLAALTIPEDELWVNLSPYEKDQMIPQGFGDTTMGRDLLAQDYLLKQLTASLIYPEEDLGDEFWSRVYKKAYEKFGTTEVPVNTFNKVWIVPQRAIIYEQNNSAFVVDSHLKVMLQEDYVSLHENINNDQYGTSALEGTEVEDLSEMTSAIVRDVLIPEIEREVNEGKTFANLRQIYNAVILASWYKMNLKDGLLGKIYMDQNKTKGVDTDDKQINEKIYQQYSEAFKTGVYNYIREDYDPVTQAVIPRKYVSGGSHMSASPILSVLRKGKNGVIALVAGIGASMSLSVAEAQDLVDKAFADDKKDYSVSTVIVENADEEEITSISVPIEEGETLSTDQDDNGDAIDARTYYLERELKEAEDIILRYENLERQTKINYEVGATLRDDLRAVELMVNTPLFENVNFQTTLRIGEMDRGFGQTYSTLKPSPFVALDMNFQFDNSWFIGQIGGGYARANVYSKSFFQDVPIAIDSIFQRPIDNQFNQKMNVFSGYMDLGKVFKVNENLAVSLFLGLDGWILGSDELISTDVDSRGLVEGNVGGNVIYYASPNDRFRFVADINFEPADKTFYQIYPIELEIVAESTLLSLDYTRFRKDGDILMAQLSTENRRISNEYSTSFSYGAKRFDYEAVVSYEKSEHWTSPDRIEVGANINFRPLNSVTIGFGGYLQRLKYDISQRQDYDKGVQLSLTWRPQPKRSLRYGIDISTSVRDENESFRVSDSDEVASRAGSVQLFDSIEKSKDFQKFAVEWQSLLANAGSYNEFVDLAIKDLVVDADDVLKTLVLFSKSASNYNYNYDYKDSPNLASQEDLYQGIVSSFFSREKNPILISGTSGQFHAKLAEDLAKGAGLDIRAIGTSTLVPGDVDGSFSGHGVTLLSTPGYGIVFAEWGRVLPTFTYDVDEAVRIYQAIEGIPGIIYPITDPQDDGSHIAYKFTEEGKLALEALTVLGAHERGNHITINRFLEAANAKLRNSSFLAINQPENRPSLELMKARWKRWQMKSQLEELGQKVEPSQKIETIESAESSSPIEKVETVGGIDLDPKLIDLQIKRNSNGVPLPVYQQPIHNMHIEGFAPVIINIVPVNLPVLLGFANDSKDEKTKEQDGEFLERRLSYLSREID